MRFVVVMNNSLMVAVKSLDRCKAVDLKPTLLHSAESEQLDDERETKSLKFLFTKMDLDVGSSPLPLPNGGSKSCCRCHGKE